jgi:pimeloyl-ACP methyl ester carboxylesterase
MKTIKNISIVVIHGNGGGGFRFELTKPEFPNRIRLYNPTLPGFNSSNSIDNYYSLKEYSDWLTNYVKDIKPPIVLMGHGLGGVFVLEFIKHHSNLIDGVILHSIVGANLNKRIFPILMKLPFIAKAVKVFIASSISRPIMSRIFFRHKIDKCYEDIFFKGFAKCNVFENMFHQINYSWFKSLTRNSLPAVFLWGQKDFILKPKEINKLEELFIKNSKTIVPDWGHFPMIDQPKSYAKEVSQIAFNLINNTNDTN